MWFWYLNFIQMAAVLWVEMENCAMVRLYTPEIVAYPCDTVWSNTGGRERVNHLKTVFNIDLIDSGRGWHCQPEFIVAPF
jgi:hypothetical protein